MNTPDFFHLLRYDQSNLKKVCSERPLDWSEYHHMNHFHGNQSIIAEYAGLAPSCPLPVGIEHAIPYDLEEAYSYDVTSGLDTFLAVHEKSARLYLDKGIDKAVPVGFSYLYALELYGRKHGPQPEVSRRGTIFFPDKSTLLMETDFDRHSLAQLLLSLPEQYQPVVVCIYWKDYVRGTHLPFLDVGLPVVSAGHIMDAEFQLRLYDLCRHFKYSAANDLAGSFTMSVLSGCHFFHLGAGPLTQRKNGKVETLEQDPSLSRPIKRSCIQASPFPPKDPVIQRKLAAENSGSEHKRTPSELRNIITTARQSLQNKHQVHQLEITADTDRSEFYSLLPNGIDIDGWCRKESKITIPKRSGAQSILFNIEIPSWAEWQELKLTCSCNVSHRVHKTLSGGYHEIQLLDDNPNQSAWHLHFQADRETRLPEQPRKRSFRILSFHQ